MVLATLTRFLGAPIEFDTIVAVLAGWTAGAAVIVLLGAPSRRPTGESIAAGLAAVGVPLGAPGAGEPRRPRLHAVLRHRP